MHVFFLQEVSSIFTLGYSFFKRERSYQEKYDDCLKEHDLIYTSGLCVKEKEVIMLTGSVPKLLKEAGRVQQALEKIGQGLPDSISAAEMEKKIHTLELGISALDALNAERTRLVNQKGEQAEDLSDYIVRARATVKGIFGADSTEYDMVGGTRASERKRGKRKEDEGE